MMKRQTVATLALLVIVLLAVAGGLSAPSVSASSLISRQEIRQQHQQSNDPVLTSLTVTAEQPGQLVEGMGVSPRGEGVATPHLTASYAPGTVRCQVKR